MSDQIKGKNGIMERIHGTETPPDPGLTVPDSTRLDFGGSKRTRGPVIGLQDRFV